MSYEIESGHPIPAGNYRTKYPWANMKHGDSFFVKDADPKKAASIKASGKRFLAKSAVNATVKSEKQNGGYRFWLDAGQHVVNPLTVGPDEEE